MRDHNKRQRGQRPCALRLFAAHPNIGSLGRYDRRSGEQISRYRIDEHLADEVSGVPAGVNLCSRSPKHVADQEIWTGNVPSDEQPV